MFEIIKYEPSMGIPRKPGIYTNCPYAVYHEIPAVRSSYLKPLDRCPASAGVPLKETKALKLGRLGHTLILEGEEAFNLEYAVVPDTPEFKINKNDNRYKKAFADFQNANIGKIIVPDSSVKDPDKGDLEMLRAIKANLLIHPTASKIIAGHPVEQTILWVDDETGILCKIRTDLAPYEGLQAIGDLKLMEDVTEYGFGQSIRKFGYYLSAGMYLEGASIAYGRTFDVAFFICAEKDEPYMVAVHELEPEYVEKGINEFHRLLRVDQQYKRNVHPVTKEKGFYPPWQHAGVIMQRMPTYLRGSSE
jgi:hypothetical protein